LQNNFQLVRHHIGKRSNNHYTVSRHLRVSDPAIVNITEKREFNIFASSAESVGKMKDLEEKSALPSKSV
jgi:hypothetical protein